MTISTPIDGECTPAFAQVRRVFEDSFAQPGEQVTIGREVGAAVAVYRDGELVVSLWGGFMDKGKTQPWRQDTLVNLFSTTKGFTAACVAALVDEGKLTYEEPACRLWPELAQHGKQDITVGDLLSHKGALPALREMMSPESLYDWEAMTQALAAEKPWWPPGTKHGYHPFTFGWLAGEIIRRASGKTMGAYFRDRFAGPLGLDAHVGLAESEDARVAAIQRGPRPPTEIELATRMIEAPESMLTRAFSNPPSLIMGGVFNKREYRAAEIPSVNGHATAHAVARFYGALARGGEIDGVRVLSEQALSQATREVSSGVDAVLGLPNRFGMGFMLPVEGANFGSAKAFGHPGAGGSIGFADPEHRLGFAYVTCSMQHLLPIDPRATALIQAALSAA
jgi:CubicO group peptidase (beta-lactamase class C family)